MVRESTVPSYSLDTSLEYESSSSSSSCSMSLNAPTRAKMETTEWAIEEWAIVLFSVVLIGIVVVHSLGIDTWGIKRRPSEPWAPFKPEQWSSHDLSDYDGYDKKRPVLLSATGLVFDVSSSESYEWGKSYNCLAGRDGSKALALMSLKEEDCISDTSELNETQLQVLHDWVSYFVHRRQYPMVGVLPRIHPNGRPKPESKP